MGSASESQSEVVSEAFADASFLVNTRFQVSISVNVKSIASECPFPSPTWPVLKTSMIEGGTLESSAGDLLSVIFKKFAEAKNTSSASVSMTLHADVSFEENGNEDSSDEGSVQDELEVGQDTIR